MSASNMSITWALSEDGTKAIILIHDRGGTVGHIILDTPELEQVIHGLATTRAAMAEPVVEDVDPGTRMVAMVNPSWRTRPPLDREGVLLILRHPGFGWLANLLPPEHARTMGRSLLDLSRGQLPPDPQLPTSSTPE